MSRASLRRYRAERLLRRDFAVLRSRVLAVVGARLRAAGAEVDRGDLEAAYATAWHGLYAAVTSGEEINDPAGWLVVVTFRRAVDEGRARARQRGKADAYLEDSPPVAATTRDVAAALDDRARLRDLFEALCARLSAREREAVTLCYLQGLSRAEAAAQMGIGAARMRKLMDGAEGRPGVSGKFGELARTVGAGQWCSEQDSLMRAYALGLLAPGGERHRLAVAHLERCPACRAQVACLRGLAAVLPPLALPRSPAGLLARRGGRAHLAAGKGGTLAAKLAAVGVLAAAGGGYAGLVAGAPAHTAHGLGEVGRVRAAAPAVGQRAALLEIGRTTADKRRTRRRRAAVVQEPRPASGRAAQRPSSIVAQPPPSGVRASAIARPHARRPPPPETEGEFGFERSR